MKKTILIVDDEKNMRWILKSSLVKEGYQVFEAEDGEEALKAFEDHSPDLILLDLRLPKIDGMTVLKKFIEFDINCPVIMMTAHGSLESAVEAMKIGALDYIVKPFDMEQLKLQIKRAFKLGNMANEIADIRKATLSRGIDGMIGESLAMKNIIQIIHKVAKTNAAVLITGDSGTGKEVVADAIVAHSNRAKEAFIKVNCGAIPPTLIESELFGHEKGAFTGAQNRKAGRFERADGGTIFLDEIGELPQELQVKLLRVLQNHEFERVGGTETLKCNVRILAATNKDLNKMVNEGKFREDLYYRLNVIPIKIPALRERPEDIRVLSVYFLDHICKDMNRKVPEITDKAWHIIETYNWPGNIRELQNLLERIMILNDEPIIDVSALPIEMHMFDEMTEFILPTKGIQLEEVEKAFIIQALLYADGVQTKAAKLLGITRHTLLYRFDKYNIDPNKFK